MKIILVLSLLFFTFYASAQEIQYDCAENKKRITEDLMKDVECVHDEECGMFDFGYPFQPDVCMKAIINVKKEEHNISNLALIEEYNNHCVYQNPDEKKKQDDFADSLEEQDCPKIPRTYCYKGFCRIQNYAIYNDK